MVESKADARFFRRVAALESGREERSSVPPLGTLGELVQALQFSGHRYPSSSFTLPGSPYLEPVARFESLVTGVHRRHGIVSAAVAARSLLMSQLAFRFRARWSGDQELLTSPGLAVFDTFGMPLSQALMSLEQHASYAGSAYVMRRATRRGVVLQIVPPSAVTVAMASTELVDPEDEAAPFLLRPAGYLVRDGSQRRPLVVPPEDMAHWAPEPDPIAWWRGESWVLSVLRDVATDNQVQDHVNQFFTHAATPNLSVSFDASLSTDQVREYAQLINEGYGGAANAWRTMVLGGGADVKPVGVDLDKLAYRDVQGGLETRIALRSLVPAPILGIREGMQGSALTTGNYGAARRRWSDGWFSPTAQGLCAVLDPLVDRPEGRQVELTFDPARVMFLQEDRKDEAEILAAKAQAAKALVEAGYDARSVTDAVTSGDLSKLVHSGLFSVQLQSPA